MKNTASLQKPLLQDRHIYMYIYVYIHMSHPFCKKALFVFETLFCKNALFVTCILSKMLLNFRVSKQQAYVFVAACCSLLQRVAVLQCHGSYSVATYFALCCNELQWVAVCCYVLQCVASSHVVVVEICMCCSVLQCRSECRKRWLYLLQCVVVCLWMYGAVAVYVAVCCSMLQ